MDAIKKCEEWEQNKRKDLEIELDDKSEKLKEVIEWLAKEKVETKKLRAELRTKSEKIREITEELTKEKRQKREIYLANKPLPKTPNKFKIFKK